MEGMEGIGRQRVARHKMAVHRAKFHAHGTPSAREGDRREVCAICQDVPTDPCTVPCGNNHVFCLACLQGLVQHGHYERHFPCPLCRKRVGIPEGGLATLQNKVLAGRSENRRRSQGQASRRMRLPLRNSDDDLPLGSVDRDEQRQILEDVQHQMRVKKSRQGLDSSSARRGRVLFDESGRMSSILRYSADLLPTASVYAEHADLDALFGYSGPRYDGNVMGVSRVTSPPNSSRLPFHSSSGGGGAAANRGDSSNDNLDMSVVMQVIAEVDGHRFQYETGASRVTGPPYSSLPFHSSSGGRGAAANRGDSSNDNLDMNVVMQVIAEVDGHHFQDEMGVSRVTGPPNSSLPFHSSSAGGGAAANRGDSSNDNLDMSVVMQVIAEMDGH